LGRDQAIVLEPLQGQIKGPVIDEEDVLGLFLNQACNTLPVLRSENQGAENEEIEGALEQAGSFVVVPSGRHPT
jgi:hypothetical protein